MILLENFLKSKKAQKVLEAEAKAIFASSRKIDSNFSKCVDLIINCKGTVVISGIGKSGIIGQKISSTLASVGIPSFYVDAASCSHVDFVKISSNDILILISFVFFCFLDVLNFLEILNYH